MKYKGWHLLGLIVLTGALGLAANSVGPTLKKVTEFDLPGPPGKQFDYLTITPDDRCLLSAHLAAGQMYVIDLRTNKPSLLMRVIPRFQPLEHDLFARWRDNNIHSFHLMSRFRHQFQSPIQGD
jgi:hypothetical protein